MTVFEFEGIDRKRLKLMPLAARRALDVTGLKLSLAGWQSLPYEARIDMIKIGARDAVDREAVRGVVADVDPYPKEIKPDDERRLETCPPALRKHAYEGWFDLSMLKRYALVHQASRDDSEKLQNALHEILDQTKVMPGFMPRLPDGRRSDQPAPDPPQLTHIDDHGNAKMVDVGEKEVTSRRAVACATMIMSADTVALIANDEVPKGDVIAAARIAGIQAAKQTPALIPLCHSVALTSVSLDFDLNIKLCMVSIRAIAEARDRTGVEMEAMVAASVAALTMYDMLKGVQRDIVINGRHAAREVRRSLGPLCAQGKRWH